jgi:uncharacterized RDD family membrane protein YckC
MGRAAAFLRRAAAYAIDYVVVAVYALALAGVTLAVAPLDPEVSKVAGYGLALATLTGPVVLVFSALESMFGASPGKALTGLRVMRGGAKPPFSRALVRNCLKFLPWELAHIGIWLTPGQPFVDPPGAVSLILMNAAMAVVVVQALLIAAFRAGVHDWATGLRVRAG